MRKLLILAVLCGSAFAQNARFDSYAFTTATIGPSGSKVIAPIPSAIITVCNYPATMSGSVCTNKAGLFSGIDANSGTVPNPISADSSGNFGVYVFPGTYTYTINAVGFNGGPYTVTLPGGATASGAATCHNSEGMRCADSYLGADYCAKGQAAFNDLPTTGGTVNMRGLEGVQSCASAINVTGKSATFLIGASSVGATCGIFTVSSSLVIEGINRAISKLLPGSFCTAIAGNNLTGAVVSQFVLRNITCDGVGSASTCLNIPSFVAGGPNWASAQITLENNVIQNFTSYAVIFGQSVYFNSVRDNYFFGNAGSIKSQWASSIKIVGNQFVAPLVTSNNPQVWMWGGDLFDISLNDFERNDVNPAGGFQGADIEFNACPTSDNGYGNVHHNKFGPEGESGTRVKIQNYCATNIGSVTSGIAIFQNIISCHGQTTRQTAIQLTNGIDRWSIDDNFFNNCTTWVDDIQSLTVSNAANSYFGHQRYYDLGGRTPSAGNNTAITVFTNGGRGFRDIYPEFTNHQWATNPYFNQQAPYLNNRIQGNSETLATGWILNNVTVATGITDPIGTTRAVTLTKAAGNALYNAGVALDNTKVGLPVDHMIEQFWCKQGTYVRVAIGILDLTTSTFQSLPTFDCPVDWFPYKFTISGLNPAHTYELVVYPGGSNDATGGTISIAFPQVSDYGSSYIPTTGTSATTDLNSGTYLLRNQIMDASAIIGNNWTTITGAIPVVTAGNNFSVTNGGATNITNFSGQTGQVINLLFTNGNSTLKYDATKIVLKGAADVTPAANQMVTLALKGAIWYEVTRNF